MQFSARWWKSHIEFRIKLVIQGVPCQKNASNAWLFRKKMLMNHPHSHQIQAAQNLHLFRIFFRAPGGSGLRGAASRSARTSPIPWRCQLHQKPADHGKNHGEIMGETWGNHGKNHGKNHVEEWICEHMFLEHLWESHVFGHRKQMKKTTRSVGQPRPEKHDDIENGMILRPWRWMDFPTICWWFTIVPIILLILYSILIVMLPF